MRRRNGSSSASFSSGADGTGSGNATLTASKQYGTYTVATGEVLQLGADASSAWPSLRAKALVVAGTIDSGLAHGGGTDAVAGALTGGTARSTNGVGNGGGSSATGNAHNCAVPGAGRGGGAGCGGGDGTNNGGSGSGDESQTGRAHPPQHGLRYLANNGLGGIGAVGTGVGSNGSTPTNINAQYSLDTLPMLGGRPGGAGGGGARINGGTSGAGGRGGRGGGCLRVYVDALTLSPGATFHSDGEAAANGTAASGTVGAGEIAGGGGGGGGGSGGTVGVAYRSRTLAGSVRANATVYNVGDKVWPSQSQPDDGTLVWYECTVGGTSHANTPPALTTTDLATVADGTVTWRANRVFRARAGAGGTGANGHNAGATSAAQAGGNGAAGNVGLVAVEKVA